MRSSSQCRLRPVPGERARTGRQDDGGITGAWDDYLGAGKATVAMLAEPAPAAQHADAGRNATRPSAKETHPRPSLIHIGQTTLAGSPALCPNRRPRANIQTIV
ncbi:MAG: hypothetical protein AMXMBFR59_16350 [Rhodanobacteraceae bacterium]